MTVPTTRRTFCHIAASLIVSILVRQKAAASSDPLTRRLSNVLGDTHSATVVGWAYLRAFPSDADQSRLVELLCSGSADRQKELAGADDEKLRSLLLLQQRYDFEHGRVVQVQGWILSQTESWLCALAAATSGYPVTQNALRWPSNEAKHRRF